MSGKRGEEAKRNKSKNNKRGKGRNKSRKFLDEKGEFCPYRKKKDRGPFCTPIGYRNELPPGFDSQNDTTVNLTLDVRSLVAIDSFEKDFTLLVQVTFDWEDQRLDWTKDFEVELNRETVLMTNLTRFDING